MTLDVGTAYTATLNVTNSSGAAVTPASVALAVTQPDQTAFPCSPFNVTPALGLQSQTITPTEAGLHQFTWTITGPTLVKTDYVSFRNFVSAISLAEAQDRLQLADLSAPMNPKNPAGTSKGEMMRLLMGASTRAVEKVVGTIVPRTFTNELISGTYRDALRVQHGPIFMPPSNQYSNGSVTTLRSAYPSGPTWQAGGSANVLLVTPMPGIIREIGLIPFWYGPWYVTYTGGRMEVAENIAEAVKEVLYDMWQTMRGLTADATAQEALALTTVPYYRMPARALEMCRDDQMPGFG